MSVLLWESMSVLLLVSTLVLLWESMLVLVLASKLVSR